MGHRIGNNEDLLARVRAVISGSVARRLGAALLIFISVQAGVFAQARSHWAFGPVRDTAPPLVEKKSWPRNTVDFFVLSQLERAGLSPLARADKRTLIRRATYDLTGLPPTYEEVEAFVADESPDAFESVIRRLLASPEYGEQWGRRWLDVVRYADTAGETADYPLPLAWRYRNYVIGSFNKDKPYNEFIREQVAGDILARAGDRADYAERVTATGFIALSRRFGFDSENYHHLTIQDTLDTLGQAVIGLSLGCARCHDHKFDPIPAKDYYALYGIFQSTRYPFPGSEQKQRMRTLVPLVPQDEADAKWQEYYARVALLRQRLERAKQPVPAAMLRSLDDMDGDFEVQAPAAGGSRGVLVPPWLYAGDISATTDAQSPFKNLYPSGRVGVFMPASSNANSLFYQAIYPARTRESGGKVHFNLDYKMLSEGAENGERRLWIGSRDAQDARSCAFEAALSHRGVAWRSGEHWETLQPLATNEWQSLQITLDLPSGVVSGSLGGRLNRTCFQKSLLTDWNGTLNFIAIETVAPPGETAPKIYLDNLAVRSLPIPPVSTALAQDDSLDAAALNERVQKAIGIDGDFEFQKAGQQPSEPWAPGPHSKVKLSTKAQSPFQNIYASGSLGVRMDKGTAYDGFMQKLARTWKVTDSNVLHASFDFQCAGEDVKSPGAWRFYLGHGAGSSAAIELQIKANGVLARNGDDLARVAELEPGDWYQVQLALDLAKRSYSGDVRATGVTNGFSGKLSNGWDGVIDHLFIDSYGNPDGPRPALHVDNFALSESALPGLDASPVKLASADEKLRQEEREELRRLLAEVRSQTEKDRIELEKLLNSGPFDLAYGVVEGTPDNARVHLRGEPEKLGKSVERGFLSCLESKPRPLNTGGSGRLELADWLVKPANPLTARVMVNRIWKYHFGRGLVDTPNDFGLRGQRPTHPDLLDHLATHFVKSGWSIKEMHRLIMLSATYQQTTAEGTDSTARELYQGVERRRLTAEELRDSILFTSGELDLAPGSTHAFPAAFTWGYTQHSPFNAIYEHNRRSVYLMQQRIKRHPFLALFDGADPNASVCERRATTVPTQSLFFLNDPIIHQSSERLATRLFNVNASQEGVVQAAWRRILSRPPSELEETEALEFLEEFETSLGSKGGNARMKAIAALARTLIGSNEFLHID